MNPPRDGSLAVFTGPHRVQEQTGRRHKGREVRELLQHQDLRPSARRRRLSGQTQARQRQVSADGHQFFPTQVQSLVCY